MILVTCKTHALDFNDGDLWDLQTYSWVNAILNTSLLLYYIFAAVAKWEDDKCNYQLFLWRFLQMQETFTKWERGYAMTLYH